ncbi:MAG: UDP-N-acetylglucosamine 2-epimerase (hydrolyzing), partial [Muribaculaceae bacterium]|nr:UDP-N-acetylglucosamine 2-epimerase (hydrolyzing) [Muribaculaceae bacterium]
MNQQQRKICIVTTTRADWGLLCPLARALRADSRCQLSVVAGNMHLDPRYGMTVDEIEADGFDVAARVPLSPADDSPQAVAAATGQFMTGMAQALAAIGPHIVVLLGDRFEMLAVASAATVMGIPLAHIAGGEITEGAIDDNVRHALTKLSALHFTATEEYRQRVISMGEQPHMVVNAGALGVYNLAHEPLISKEQLEASVGMTFDSPTLLVTLHPATRDTVPAATRGKALLDALDRFPHARIIFTHPNTDPAGRV